MTVLMATSTVTDRVEVAPGKWLRGDAAGSYLRMLAAGLPAGGIDAFSRTFAQQTELRRRYEMGIGPVAARPNLRAPHIAGVAMDAHTTTAGRYAPSPAHVWLTRGGDGSRPPKRLERIRSHAYGWYRTVPSERWHFGYLPGKDSRRAADLKARLKRLGYRDVKAFQTAHGLTPDGVDGPKTWTRLLVNPKVATTPPPVVVPPPNDPSTAVLLRFGQANLQAERWKGLPDDSPKRGEFLRTRMKCSLYALAEASEEARNAIRDAMGGRDRWKTYPIGYVAVMWDTTKWRHDGKASVSFGTPYHGAIRAQLVHTSGRKLDVIALHVRPRASFATDAAAARGKQADIAAALKLVRKGVPTILAGDFNTRSTEIVGKAGLSRATQVVDTVDGPTVDPLDQVWTSGLVVRGTTQVDPGLVSDHTTWVVKATLVPNPFSDPHDSPVS